MNQPDYPAAHSMDTTWFAVDKHGHIGVFDSWEAGAVPKGLRDNGTDLIDRLRENGMDFFVGDLLDSPDGKVFLRDWETNTLLKFDMLSHDKNDDFYDIVLWLDNETTLEQLAAYGTERVPSKKMDTSKEQLESTSELIVKVGQLPVRVLRRLLSEHRVLRVWLDLDEQADRYGVFNYTHGDDFEGWVAGPYLKLGEPAKPIKLSDLPQGIEEEFGKFKTLDADFARDDVIQPLELTHCSTHGDHWIDLDGNMRQVKQDS